MQIFPPNNFWNTPIDTLPLLSNSTPMMAEINASGVEHIHLDDVMPLNFVTGGPMFTIPDGSGGDSDPGLYLISPNAVVENGTNIADGNDHHMLVIDTVQGILYETYQLNVGPPLAGYIQCKWDLGSNAQRSGGSDPGDLASCDAAGMPIAPGVLQYADILAGAVTHALRTSMRVTYSGAYLWPATHFTRSAKSTANSPMFCTRLRLKASFDVTGFSAVNQIILNGMKKYGLNVSDNGIYGACQHDQDSRWDATDLLNLHNVPLTAFEAVDTSSLMVNAASAMTPPIVQSVMMGDKLGRSNAVPLSTFIALIGGVAPTSIPTPTPTPTPGAITGRYVRVQLSGNDLLSLAEVQVLGLGAQAATNLALNQPASQSSDYSSASGARLAVDGKTDGNYYDGSVTATQREQSPWWQVDLGRSQPIGSIVIWNRTDSTPERLADFWVFVSDTPFLGTDTPTTLQKRVNTWASHQAKIPAPSVTIPVQ